MNIRNYTFEEFVERVKAFHGYEAPGVIIGGFYGRPCLSPSPEGWAF